MPRPASRPHRPPLELARTLRWTALPWLAHGVVFGALLWWSNYFRGQHVTLPQSVFFALPASAMWWLATPFIVALSRRVHLARGRWAGGALAYLLAWAALHVAIAGVQYALFRLRTGGQWQVPLIAFLADWSITDLVRFGVVVFATKSLDGWRATRLARRRAQRLRAELAEAELELLHLRLQPHFLFNALSAISELVHEDPARADRALVAMGDLLRRGLATSGRPVVPLSEELEALADYLALERIRWSHRLEVTTDIDPRALAAGVPNFALQPVVENCLRHGLAGRDSGHVRIAAWLDDGRLVITVEDDGAGLAPRPLRAAGGGRGLANVRARLARLYGDAAALTLEAGPAGGALARLVLPARAATPAPAEPGQPRTDAPTGALWSA